MAISAKQVQELRGKTGAGIMDCKKVLAETEGNIEQAIDLLRKKGLSAGSKRAGKVASEGLVGCYGHGGKIGVLVEVNCETDFVARNEAFQNFVKDIGMHIAASNPKYVCREEVPTDEVNKEKEILAAQITEQGKPANVVEKIIEGRINKYFKDICLLEQPFVKDPDNTIEKLQNELIASIGEKIAIRRFTRFEVGEGIEKKSEDFAAEVAATMASA